MIPGEACTYAVALHRLGIKVGWVVNFGNDPLSQMALDYLSNEGLDPSLFVIHKKSYRRISTAVSFDHDRAFISYYAPEPDSQAV